jgi:hypothetical protein
MLEVFAKKIDEKEFNARLQKLVSAFLLISKPPESEPDKSSIFENEAVPQIVVLKGTGNI